MIRQVLEPSAPSAAIVTERTMGGPPRPSPWTGLSFLAEPRFTCASCRVEIRGPATFHVGVAFCCAGCVAGGPCTCSYDVEPDAAGNARHPLLPRMAQPDESEAHT